MRLHLLEWVLLRPGLGLCFTRRRSAAKPPILAAGDHEHGIKVRPQIFKSTIVLMLKLVDELVELTLGSVDLPDNEIGSIL